MPERSRELELWMLAQTWPDLRRLAEKARTSYRHPYGFVVVRLDEPLFEGWQVRLHFWPAPAEFEAHLIAFGTAAQQVHAHGWDLVSRVLIGALEESTFEVTLSERSERALFSVRSDYGTGHSHLEKDVPSVDVNLIGRSLRTKEDGCVLIHRDTYHSSMPLNPSASLVATQTVNTATSHIVGPADIGATSRNERRPASDLTEILKSFDEIYSLRADDDDAWASFLLLVDATHRVLLVRSRRRPDLWQPVGGRSIGVDPDAESTLAREVREEVGMDVSHLTLERVLRTTRDVGSGDVYFWAASLAATPALRLDESELLEAAWFTEEELANLPLYPGTRRALALVLKAPPDPS
jgi:8-oxo-dGTP pyrophosphatase MutT (NUDIX family)